ncbi:hypothetical protein LTR70_000872 [Exophiala xenobiotica]|uniref:BTB domain-containing protein n=1 Tax=Lithohypha guttulata TaxID=1690604 RepID=A0ABR0KK93_9EURO|nr:hypothetical protein LTR24_001634 [Lithohypha guttulata]KAK5329036.1 hypothetical protein LTR70_000872 [Exophiala xenobiotica]
MASTPSSQSAGAVASPSTQSTPPGPGSETPRKFAASEIVALFVGKKRKKFEIRKDLLIAKSTYFQAALAADWEEGKSNEVYWDDEDVEAVSVFVDWLYGRDVAVLGLTASSLLFCYDLAHKRGIVSFKNDVMNAFRKWHADGNFGCNPILIQHSNGRGLSDTPLHDCILRSVVEGMVKRPNEFLEREDLATRLDRTSENSDSSRQIIDGILRYLSAPWPNPHYEKGSCYHDHPDGKACETEKCNK